MQVKSTHYVYVKLPIYVGQYIRRTFGSDGKSGILLPDATEVKACFCSSLVENKTLLKLNNKKHPVMSYSECSFNFDKSSIDDSEIDNLKIPNDDDRVSLFAFVLPHTLWRDGECVQTNKYYELSFNGATQFRRICIESFWTSLNSFVLGCESRAIRDKMAFNRSMTIEKFLSHYCIDVSLYETVQRNYNRRYLENKINSVK